MGEMDVEQQAAVPGMSENHLYQLKYLTIKKPDHQFHGNPAVLKDPWLSVPALRQVWLFHKTEKTSNQFIIKQKSEQLYKKLYSILYITTLWSRNVHAVKCRRMVSDIKRQPQVAGRNGS
jgi:hypothetical protein